MALEDENPVIANPQFTLDMEEAIASMQRLFSYHAKRIIFDQRDVFDEKASITNDCDPTVRQERGNNEQRKRNGSSQAV
jgi:hypothetical protein